MDDSHDIVPAVTGVTEAGQGLFDERADLGRHPALLGQLDRQMHVLGGQSGGGLVRAGRSSPFDERL